MDAKLRDFFDERLERVLAELPRWLLDLLEETPLVVEDHPPREVLQSLGISNRRSLCGLYTGVPLTDRKRTDINLATAPPNQVTIYREGILQLAAEPLGRLTERELLRQIRITVLHELGHHHGLNEEDLRQLGYQ